jgi:aspartate aminotransferase
MVAMAHPLSSNVSELRESATIAASARAKALRAAGRKIIDLGAGEPDFDTPAFIREAARKAIESGATRYTATEGILPLREAVAASASEMAGRAAHYGASDVVVSTGTKQSLFNSCFTLFGPGDEVLIPTPGWTSYYEIISLARAIPVPVEGDPDRGFKVDVDMLSAAATPKTRGLILNSPCNPTGAVYSRSELKAILALAAKRGWWLISDEIYRRISYEEEATSLLQINDGYDRVVVIDGVAKAYAMTGWRIGWSISARDIAKATTALQSHTTSNASSVSQHAALAALTNRDQAEAAIAGMVGKFRERRDAALATLRSDPAVQVIDPQGAFYLFMRVGDAHSGEADAGGEFARRMLDDHDVAIVQGSAFFAPDWVRISYAAPSDQVQTAIERIMLARQGARA